MTRRRDFLKTTLGALGASGPVHELSGAARRARELVRRGEVGRIAFCRVEHAGLLAVASLIADPADCVMAVEPGAEGVALLGSRGTLVVTDSGCRLFARESCASLDALELPLRGPASDYGQGGREPREWD